MSDRQGEASYAVVVLDGFGIGAMPDAGEVRTGDRHADTLGSLVRWSRQRRGRELAIPNLAALGLAALRPDLGLRAAPPFPGIRARYGRAALGYPGADTFAGHQTMMGADMSHVTLARVADYVPQLLQALRAAGFTARAERGGRMVLVEDAAIVHDNLEADPALNWNVSARLADMDWEQIEAISRVVRAVAPVARVIAVGGVSDGPLDSFVRDGAAGTVGLDTPASGFYRNGGLRVNHMGADIDHSRQLPQVAASAGLGVALVGKAADILATDDDVERHPAVETAEILQVASAAIGTPGLQVINVQQTDLAGHQQDPERFADLIEQVDSAVPGWLAGLGSACLIITADHGNDPLIGHAFHTREYVPILAATRAEAGARAISDQSSLAVIAGTGSRVLGLDPARLGNGSWGNLLGI